MILRRPYFRRTIVLNDKTHPQTRGSRKIPILAALGALLLTFSVCALYLSVPDLLQYAFQPENSGMENGSSSGGEKAAGTESAVSSVSSEALKKYGHLQDPSLWAGEDVPMALHGFNGSLSVSRAGSEVSITDVSVELAGPRYAEVFPRKIIAGTFLSFSELSSAAPSAVLDSALAFRLFGAENPLGQKIRLDGSSFTVVGIASHSRSLGSARTYTLWVPLNSLSAEPELLTVSALPTSLSDSLSSLWKSKAQEFFGSGTFLNLRHEKTGATLLPRILLFFFAVLLLKKWFSVLRRWGTAFLSDARERLSQSYFSRLIGYFILRGLAALLLLAGTLALCWGLAAFVTEPLTAFPDWVPENPADFSSWIARFWALVGIHAAPVRLITEQAAILSFWSFLIRIGTVLLLLGLLSFLLRRRSEKN